MIDKGTAFLFNGILISFFLMGCKDNNTNRSLASEPSQEISQEAEVIEETPKGDLYPIFEWTGMHADFEDWNKYTFDGLQSLGSDLIKSRPRDVENFCPNYDFLNETQKTYFWIQLIAAMTRYESFFDPTVQYQENFKDSTSEFIISRGLMQLSYESSRGYRCPISSPEDLHDAKINLQCSVKILNQWITRDGVITDKIDNGWKGGARYWAVLRSSSRIDSIQNITSDFPLCQMNGFL